MSQIVSSLHKELEGKRTVRECLRSKCIPSPEVADLLLRYRTAGSAAVPSLDDLQLAYSKILTEYLSPLRDVCTQIRGLSGDAKQVATHSVLVVPYISKAATVSRFIQLVLECDPNNKENAHGQINRQDRNLGDDSEQLFKFAMSVIRSYAGIVCSILEEGNSTAAVSPGADPSSAPDYFNDDLSTLQPAPVIASFAFGSLLKLNHYVNTKPFILSPLWKGICDIYSHMNQAPSELLSQAIDILSKHLYAGGQQLLSSGVSFLESLASSKEQKLNHPVSDASFKIVSFLIARMNNLLKKPLPLSLYESLHPMTRVLCFFRGLSPALSGYAKQLQLPSETTLQHTLKSYQILSTKATKCLDSWFATIAPRNEQPLWSSVISMCVESSCIDSKVYMPGSSCSVRTLSNRALAFGLTVLQSNILQSRSTVVHPGTNKAEYCEHMIKLTRNLLFVTLPICGCLFTYSDSLEPFQSQQLIVSTLSTLIRVDEMLPSVSSSNRIGRDTFYRLLISWLCPLKRNGSDSIAIEILQSSLFLFVVKTHGRACTKALIKLCVHLFFDRRSKEDLASMLLWLLYRLLASNFPFVSQFVVQCVEDEIPAYLDQFSANKKRKRGQKTRQIDAHDFNILKLLASIRMKCSRKMLPTVAKRDKFDSHSLLSLILAPFDEEELSSCLCALALRSTCLFEYTAFLTVLSICRVLSIEKRLSVNLITKLLETATRISGDMHANCELSQLAQEAHRNTVYTLSMLGKSTGNADPNTSSFLNIFRVHLSCIHWIKRLDALASLVKFAAECDESVRRHLPATVPSSIQKLLQGRIKALLPELSLSSVSAYMELHLHSNMFPCERRFSDAVAPKISNCLISPGSFVLSMPTQDGRQAIVIFPPERDSLQDIEYMLGGETAQIATIQSILVKDGIATFRLQEN